ncbi:unnamed protein product [Arabidopsis lyrata]|nr:unnamed protein product [Arabidopsis lyrata]
MGTNVASRMLDGVVKLPKQLFGDGRASAVPVHEDRLHEYLDMMMAVQGAFAEGASSKVFGGDKSRI